MRSALRRKYYRIRRLLSNPAYRKNYFERKKDLKELKKVVGSWGRTPIQGVSEDKLFGIISFTDLPMHAKFHGIAAKALELQGYTPIIFTLNRTIYAHKCFELFGVKKLAKWFQYVDNLKINPDEVHKMLQQLISKEITVQQAMNIEFHGVEVGKHALSMTCRKRIEGKLDLRDEATYQLFYEQFYNAILHTLAAELFFEKYPVKKLLVRDSGYIPNGPIYEVALNKGIDCIVLEFGQRKSSWVFKRYTKETRSRHYFSVSSPTWEQLKKIEWTEELNARLEKEFEGRYKSNSEDDTRRLQAGKVIKTKAEIQKQLGLDPSKKTAIIFSHVAWDAAFFYGEGLFSDFEDWLFETVKYVSKECPQLNWIVKIHPFNVFKLQRESVDSSSEMRLLRPLFPLPDHVKLVHPDTDINTKSFFELSDYILTVNGTVGMEFPCFGVPAILAGTGRYNGFGFTTEPQSIEAYFEVLKNLENLPALTEEQIELAKKHFYFLMKGKQVMFEDVAPMELLKVHEAQNDLHDNIHLITPTLEAFKAANSVKLLGEWIANSDAPDILSDEITILMKKN